MPAFTKHCVLSQVQAETLARLYYGLPDRNYKGRPCPRQSLCWNALKRRGLVTQDGYQITQLGITMLNWYLGKKGAKKCKRTESN